MDFDNTKKYLITIDPKLKIIFDNVKLDLSSVIKPPHVALIGAIIGQKISYQTAKKLRGQLYELFGNNFTPRDIINAKLPFSDKVNTIIKDVTQYIIKNKLTLVKGNEIKSLTCVKGIGNWTVETTLLTSLLDYDIFPLGDTFLKNRMKRLYGANCDIENITKMWSPYRSIVTWYMWRWF